MKFRNSVLLVLALLAVAVFLPVHRAEAQGCRYGLVGTNETTGTQNCKYGPGTLNLTGTTVTGLSSDDLTATDDLSVQDDSNLGNDQTDITTVTGLLNLDKYAQIGIPCRNETGAAFGAGDVVTFDNSSGWTETNTARLVKLADNDANLFGHAVITATLASGSTGTCYLHWRSSATLNTNGLAVGAPIYLSATATTTNTWTSSAPTGATSIGQKVGYVAVASATVGVIVFDFMPPRVYRFGTNELQLAAVTATEIASGAVLTDEIGANTILQADVSRVFGTGTAPAPSTCGTGSPAIVGSDMSFKLTVGTGDPAACTVTFNSTFTNTPACVFTSASSAFAVGVSAASATAVTLDITATGDSSSLVIYGICIGNDAD